MNPRSSGLPGGNHLEEACHPTSRAAAGSVRYRTEFDYRRNRSPPHASQRGPPALHGSRRLSFSLGGVPPIPPFEQNRLLALLADRDLRLLIPDFKSMTLESSAVLFEPGQPIDHVYFPLTGVVSLVVTGEDGDVEVATIGNEGMVGLGGLLAGDVSFSRQVVQLGGQAIRIARTPFLATADQSPRMRRLLAAHADAFASQLMQSAACNARHDTDQRLARWLLTMADRSGQTTLAFTQHAAAEMLGVQRPTVTLSARMMQSAGLIDYRRGVVTVVDRPGLMDLVCECYGIIRDKYDDALKMGP